MSQLDGPVDYDSKITPYRKQQEDDDRDFPNRPRNHSPTLPFHTLYQDLFNPLIKNQGRSGPVQNRRKLGPRSVNSQNPHERRNAIIETYISRWRREVGDDFYPAMRLILPDKDRRAVFGIRENVLAKFLIKVLKIDKNSDDAKALLNFKSTARRSAGNFPAVAFDVLAKRPFRNEPGSMTVEDVNSTLDKLAAAVGGENQLPIIEMFYRQMNPEELKWLFCVILKSMHIGATERTILRIWHLDAEDMYNKTSHLKNVCWILYNNSIKLETEADRSINVGQCIQPQLAFFDPKKVEQHVKKMAGPEDDLDFWIEEKLDGERMQMHTWIEYEGGKKEGGQYEPAAPYRTFRFWSRKAKDYTYLYGEFLHGDNEVCSFTRYLENAFEDGVDSLILDGEMIEWDPTTDRTVPFGTLKTAALAQQRNQYSTKPQPVFRVFDILYLNGKDLIRYDLKTRRQALERVLKSVKGRIEILPYSKGRTWGDVQTALRKVILEASEGLVVKNPCSRYRLNDRNTDWIKVKPEYMDEFGESLDCLIIGGYWGSGRRGGILSSFLCGLRVDNKKDGGRPPKFLSFFKVGGGITATEYAYIQGRTDGKWVNWNEQTPLFIELAGTPQHPRERPDMWIRPEDSLVIQAKASSVAKSDEFAAKLTLRFPRFQRFRDDKSWEDALTYQDFLNVKDQAEKERSDKNMQAATNKRRRIQPRIKQLEVAGYTTKSINEAAEQRGANKPTNVFSPHTFFVMTDTLKPERKSKLELEELIKAHGGKIVQTASPKLEHAHNPGEVICIASKRVVRVKGIVMKGELTVLKPEWIFDCIEQARRDTGMGLAAILLQPEIARHVFFSPDNRVERYEGAVDSYGDSFERDVTVEELRERLKNMNNLDSTHIDGRLLNLGGERSATMLRRTVLYIAVDTGNPTSQTGRVQLARNIARFAGARIVEDLRDLSITHVVVSDLYFHEQYLMGLRQKLADRKKLPRMVTLNWLEDCWKEKTRLDEEKYLPW